MASYLLDTSVIIDLLNNKRGRDALLKALIVEGNSLACCAINITEVYAGMRPHEKARTDEFLNSLEYFQITREVAAKAGLLKRSWADRGVTLSVSDVTIAALALSGNLTLITDNAKHYPMPELKLYPLSGRR